MATSTSPRAFMNGAADRDTSMTMSPVNAPARVSIASRGPQIRTTTGATPVTPSASTSTASGVSKLNRRDSLERREAFLKGKEGSRQRRRWENDRLLSNPWAEPPLPSDWEIRPTYPRRNIPYYLAPLWDAAEFQRAVEAKLSGGSRRGSAAAAAARHRNRKHGSLRYPGMSPIEETATSIPKEVKARLKKSRAAKGLLMDLEEQVRGWVQGELRGGVSAVDNARHGRRDRAGTLDSVDSGAVVMDETDETDEEDEEIVFVGRKGVVVVVGGGGGTTDDHDYSAAAGDAFPRSLNIPIRPKKPATSPAPSSSSSSSPCHNHPRAKEDHLKHQESIHRSKMIFAAPEDDQSASFARWLVHCVGSYYGLRTWSVTREGEQGEANRREAYVGIDERARGFIVGRCGGGGGGGDEVAEAKDADRGEEHAVETRREIELPRPLWGMV